MSENTNYTVGIVSIPLGALQRLENLAIVTGETKEKITLEALERYFAEFQVENSYLSPEELADGYKAMANDKEREEEAQEWCNSYLGEDLTDEKR